MSLLDCDTPITPEYLINEGWTRYCDLFLKTIICKRNDISYSSLHLYILRSGSKFKLLIPVSYQYEIDNFNPFLEFYTISEYQLVYKCVEKKLSEGGHF